MNPESPAEMDLMKENLRLCKELEEAKKENLFLKYGDNLVIFFCSTVKGGGNS